MSGCYVILYNESTIYVVRSKMLRCVFARSGGFFI